MNRGKTKPPPKNGLHIVALFEAAKGLLVLLVGCGLLGFIHKDVHLAAEQLVRHLHLNPASHYPSALIDAANRVTDLQLWALALSGVLYSVVRFAEAYGLWKGLQWAEWFGFLTGGMYIPIEILEVIRKVTWPRVTVLTVNLGVVAFLAYVLFLSGKGAKKRGR